MDKDLLDGYFSNGRLSDVRQRNLIGANLASLHVKANERMKREGLMLEQDNYSPHEASSVKVCRPPFEALHIMSAPWLSRYNNGKVPHIGVFSTKQMLQFKGKGWQLNSCVYFSEDSVIPSSILDGTAWSSSSCIEGRSLIEKIHALESGGNAGYGEGGEGTVARRSEPENKNWFADWNTGDKSNNLFYFQN